MGVEVGSLDFVIEASFGGCPLTKTVTEGRGGPGTRGGFCMG